MKVQSMTLQEGHWWTKVQVMTMQDMTVWERTMADMTMTDNDNHGQTANKLTKTETIRQNNSDQQLSGSLCVRLERNNQ